MSAMREILKANLLAMVEREESDPKFYGPKIAELSRILEA
jgi:hypothetical protein